MEVSGLTPEQLDTYNQVYKPFGTTIAEYIRTIKSAQAAEASALAAFNAKRQQFTFKLFNGPYNLVTVPVNGDGNCFARALSQILYGDDIHYPMIRSAIAEYLDKNREIFRLRDSADRIPDRFLEKFRNGAWAEGPAIEAASQLYERDIRIYQIRGDMEENPEWQSENFPQNPQITLFNDKT